MKPENHSAFQATSESVSTLIIGDLRRWKSEGRDTASYGNFTFLSLAELTGHVLSDVTPKIILSPLIADDFDALDVAVTLASLGYSGCYRALTSLSEDAVVIRQEISAVAPLLDFDILSIS